MQKQNPFLNALMNLDTYLAGASLLLIVLTNFLGVIMRYIFNSPFIWLEEISTGLFAWFVFWGASACVRNRRHVSVEIIVDKLPTKVKMVVSVLTYLLIVVTHGYLFYWGMKLTMQAMTRKTSALRIPYAWIDYVLPVSMALMLVFYTVNFVQDMKAFRNAESNYGRGDEQ